MKWNNFTSNSSEGDRFINDMMNSHYSMEKTREKFSEFINMNGYSAFHIHDGWVMFNHRSGRDVINNEFIHITWIDSHAGYSHTPRCPNKGEKMVVVSDLPYDGTESILFKIYCYGVVEKERCSITSDKIKLRRLEVKQVNYNHLDQSFSFHIEKKIKTWFQKLLNK